MIIKINEYIELSKEQRQIHLKLDEPCLERGGCHNNYRGVLTEYLGTEFPSGNKIHCCHACNNDKCSNPRHLYWGTARENQDDSGILEMAQKAAALAKLGKPLSEQHKQNISKANLKRKLSQTHKDNISKSYRGVEK